MPKEWDIAALEHKARVTESLIQFFARQIDEHGTEKACAILKLLSKRHLRLVESKSVEWEGLTLSRQPNEIEQRCVKAIAESQDDGKAKITKILLDARVKLNKEAIAALEDMQPANYHALVLTPPKSARKLLRSQLDSIYLRGRTLVAEELGTERGEAAPVKQTIWGFPVAVVEGLRFDGSWDSTPISGNGHSTKADDDIDSDLLDELTDLTLSRLTNAQQSRIIEILSSLATLGVAGSVLLDRLKEQVSLLSDAPLEQIASGVSNRLIGEGRADEMEARADDIIEYEFSCILDRNLCDECAPFDGDKADTLDGLPSTPLDTCLGGPMCRCFIIAHFGGEQ